MKLAQTGRPTLLLFAAICLLGASSAEAVLIPGTLAFTDGNGTTSVDQYRGTAGNGWLEAWVPSGTITTSVVDTNPIGAGGNYLSLADVNGGQGVTRQFLAPTTYPYRLMLDLRVDAIPTSGNRTINLSTGSVRSVNTNNTNYVQANATQGGNWRFHGDNNRMDTSTIPLVKDTTYHFDFLVDPVNREFAVTVSDGTNSWSTSSAIQFREQTTLVANPFFELGAQGGVADAPFAFSLDNIVFAPEPSSHFTDGGSGSDWSTAANWDNGVPVAQTFAYIGASNSATLSTTGAEAFQVIIGHTGNALPGNGTLNQTGGDLAVANGLLIGVKTTGSSDISGAYTATGGTLTVGSLANRGNIILGYNSAGNTTDAFGTLDLSGASQFDAYLDELSIGEVTSSASNGTGGGTLKLAPTSNIDAKEIMVSWSSMHSATQPTSTIELGDQTTIKADTFTVAGFRGMALVKFGAGGGTLTLSGSSGTETDLLIANCDSGTNNPVNGHMDMSGGTFNATLDRLLIGYDLTGPGGGGSVGKLTFGAGTITANSLTLGDAANDGLGNGTLNMSGGSLTVNGNATLGTGTAESLGTINLTGGTLGVTGSATGGLGTSTVNVAGGTMTVGGNMAVSELVVGDSQLTGAFTASGEDKTLSIGKLAVAIGSGTGTFTAGAGSNVQIGTAANRTDLIIARKTTAFGLTGTVDLAAADSLTAYLNRLFLAYQTTHDTSGGDNIGILKLAETNEIHANHIIIGLVDSGATTVTTATIELGQSNTILANTFTIGGAKSTGSVEFADGVVDGVLNLGTEAARVNLNIGYNAALDGSFSTGRTAAGHLDGSGGTINAWLNNVVIGYQGVGGSGQGIGTLTLESGTIDANTILLGDRVAGSTGNNQGTIELKGGALRAGSIARGDGQAVFDWTGGRLSVDTFGSEARPFNLVQNGGTLAPGNSPGMTTIYGNYTMAAAGALEIEINGLDQGDQGLVGDADDGIGYDFVMVHGDASLAGSLNVLLLDGFYPVLGTHFDVLQTTGSLDITGLTLNDTLAPLTFGWWEMATIPSLGGEGFTLRLSAVPEPSSATLLLLALLASYLRRRR